MFLYLTVGLGIFHLFTRNGRNLQGGGIPASAPPDADAAAVVDNANHPASPAK